jgi:hypothetical protein
MLADSEQTLSLLGNTAALEIPIWHYPSDIGRSEELMHSSNARQLHHIKDERNSKCGKPRSSPESPNVDPQAAWKLDPVVR